MPPAVAGYYAVLVVLLLELEPRSLPCVHLTLHDYKCSAGSFCASEPLDMHSTAPYFIRVYFWRHTLHMKACCVRYGKGVLYLGVKRIIPMSRFGIGSNYQYWFISTEFYRYWLLPVNSPIVVYRHHGTVLLRTFWPAAAYFFQNLITFQQIGTSTHFLPCPSPHRSQNLANEK